MLRNQIRLNADTWRLHPRSVERSYVGFLENQPAKIARFIQLTRYGELLRLD